MPWDVVIPAVTGAEEKPVVDLDQRLVDALLKGPLSEISDAQRNARVAALAFLYLYMSLSKGEEQ